MKFRRSVYAVRGKAVTAGCQLLMLRLSDSMDTKLYVSVPHTKLAADLAAPEPRISEWIREAVDKGILSRVERGRPGVTSRYQGLDFNPYDLRRRVSATYARRGDTGVRPGVSDPAPESGADLRPAPPLLEGNRPQPPNRLHIVTGERGAS